MSATDMSKAGIELDCMVKIAGHRSDYKVVEIQEHIVPIDGRRDTLVMCYYNDGDKWERVGPFYGSTIVRDYNDAQQARHRRLARLMEHFPDDGTAMVDDGDTLQRYALVLLAEGLSQEYSLYQFGDTFEDCVRGAGVSILDDFQPQGVFDLDTGRKVEVVVEPPVLKMSASQDVFVNELDEIIL